MLEQRLGPHNPEALAAVSKLIDEKIAAMPSPPIEELARVAMGLGDVAA